MKELNRRAFLTLTGAALAMMALAACGADGLRAADVAHHRGLDAAHRVARLERVDALLVGGDAHGGARKDNADELQRFPRSGVGHP